MVFTRNAGRRSGWTFVIASMSLAVVSIPRIAEAGGVPYEACGDLVDSGGFPSCLLHVADDGQIVRPFNLDGFRAGDRVVVSGLVDEFSASICNSTITPNLSENTIERCFAECGTLVEVGGCLRFDSDRGGAFIVPGAELFEDGARVFVRGTGISGIENCGGDDLSIVAFPYIAPCTSVTGRISSPFGCPNILSATGERFDVFTLSGFNVGDYVTIEGDASLGVAGGCGNPLVDLNTIREAFGGPGTLVDAAECGLVFQAGIAGNSAQYRLDDVGAFAEGDRVIVTGRIDDDCAPDGNCALPCLVDNTIGAITTACGTFDIGSTECVVFTPDDGGAPFLIEHTQAVPFGVPVFVAGTFRPDPGICANAEALPVMRDNLFLQCIDVCGRFEMGFECTPLFLSDDGGIFTLENLGPYSLGDRARIRGGLGGICNPFCPFTCVRVNSIEPCDVIPADVNGDGSTDVDDVQLFVAVLLGLDDDPYRVQVSDVNADGTPDGGDIQPFTLIVLGQM